MRARAVGARSVRLAGSCAGCRLAIDRLIDLHHDASNAGEATGAQG